MNVKTLALLAALTAGTTAVADTSGVDQGDLTVELIGLKSDAGRVVFAMWSGPENWLRDDAIREGSVPIENGQGTIRIQSLPYGEYAISAFHDVNANQKLDTGFFRIPKEPIGTSNDPKVRFGPPKYDDARFVFDQPELTITIPIKKVFE